MKLWTSCFGNNFTYKNWISLIHFWRFTQICSFCFESFESAYIVREQPSICMWWLMDLRTRYIHVLSTGFRLWLFVSDNNKLCELLLHLKHYDLFCVLRWCAFCLIRLIIKKGKGAWLKKVNCTMKCAWMIKEYQGDCSLSYSSSLSV